MNVDVRRLTNDTNVYRHLEARPERSARDPDAVLYSRLADAIAWCSSILADNTVDSAMRTADLTPRLLHDGQDDAVCDVGSTRHWRVRATTNAPQVSMPDLEGGRLLCCFPDADLCDGAAEQESEGFFDVYNTPPWDTWIGYFCDRTDPNSSYDNYLLAYVPEELVSLADGGIVVNPEECIMWLEDADVKLRCRILKR